jgi:hypothetical protein
LGEEACDSSSASQEREEEKGEGEGERGGGTTTVGGRGGGCFLSEVESGGSVAGGGEIDGGRGGRGDSGDLEIGVSEEMHGLEELRGRAALGEAKFGFEHGDSESFRSFVRNDPIEFLSEHFEIAQRVESGAGEIGDGSFVLGQKHRFGERVDVLGNKVSV